MPAGETFGNMVVVTIGVAIASYGELNFHVLGVVLQLLSVCTESTRLTLVQILLQRRGLSLNPITTVSPTGPCLLNRPPLSLQPPGGQGGSSSSPLRIIFALPACSPSLFLAFFPLPAQGSTSTPVGNRLASLDSMNEG